MLFDNKEQLLGRAMYVGQRLDLKAFEQSQRLATNPLVVKAGTQGVAVLFRYGVVVVFGLTPIEEVAFLKGMQNFTKDPFEEYEAEEVQLCLSHALPEKNSAHLIPLDDFNMQRLQVVASVLAKSAILSHYEIEVAQTFERIEPLARSLQQGEGSTHNGQELLAHIGDVLLIQGRMVGRVEVSDKPELLWEEPQYERLHLRMADEYELIERHHSLERKLELISKTAETLLALLHNKRSHRVEWYIVILIVIEVMLTVYEMWGKHLLQ